MDILLSRAGGVPVKDQLCFQLELKILAGDIAPGQKLPSVRALARRLHLHPNTVSAAYQDLEATGHVELKRGTGVFVRPGAPQQARDARDLDEVVRLGLYEAFRRGFARDQIRSAVERWLAAAPPDRVVVADPNRAMAELMAHELRLALGISAGGRSIAEVERDPRGLGEVLLAALPYHLETLARLVPGATIEPLTIGLGPEDLAAIGAQPEGSVILLVSCAESVLPFAEVLLRSLRGDAIFVHARPLQAPEEWRPLLPGADLVLADVVAADVLRRAGGHRIRELRMLSPDSIQRVRAALTLLPPALEHPVPARSESPRRAARRPL